MSLVDLVTRQDLEPLAAKLDQLLALHAQAAAAPAAEEPLLSMLEVVAYAGFDRKTVEKWVREGRYNEKGKRVYLRVYEFSGRWRFKRADVLAFGQSIGVLAPTLPGEPPRRAKPAPTPPTAPVASAEALRVA